MELISIIIELIHPGVLNTIITQNELTQIKCVFNTVLFFLFCIIIFSSLYVCATTPLVFPLRSVYNNTYTHTNNFHILFTICCSLRENGYEIVQK